MRTCEGKLDFSKLNFRLATTLDLIKCLEQIESPIKLHACAQFLSLEKSFRKYHGYFKILFLPIVTVQFSSVSIFRETKHVNTNNVSHVIITQGSYRRAFEPGYLVASKKVFF